MSLAEEREIKLSDRLNGFDPLAEGVGVNPHDRSVSKSITS